MLKKLQRPNNKGFTIIEVMIVLAIAALILLIVLLAVPALQRSSRNTQRKNDASAIAGAYSNFTDNNNGATPTGLAINGTPDVLICAAGGASQAAGTCTAGANSETAKLGYYTSGNIYFSNVAAVTVGAAASGSVVTTNTVIIDHGYTCNDNNNGVGIVSPRSAAILYATEGSGNGQLQCVEQ